MIIGYYNPYHNESVSEGEEHDQNWIRRSVF